MCCYTGDYNNIFGGGMTAKLNGGSNMATGCSHVTYRKLCPYAHKIFCATSGMAVLQVGNVRENTPKMG